MLPRATLAVRSGPRRGHLLSAASRSSSSGGPTHTIYVSDSNNPFFNIAFEQYLFESPKTDDEKVLYLWRNEPSVIIGRFQGAWKECNMKAMEADKVNLVRRSSGGGAVYQDLGNSIFSFLGAKHGPEGIAVNNAIIISALQSLGIEASPTGRNDIEVGGSKVSGAAFRHSKQRSLHHGTLLLDLDLQALGRYLTPNKLKLQSKGVSSVAARVMNLKTVAPSISHDAVNEILKKSFQDYYNAHDCPVIHVDESFAKTNEEVSRNIAKIMDWEWRFGSEPRFSHHMETKFGWGLVDLYLEVKEGRVKQATFNTDALDVEFVNAIQRGLMEAEYSPSGIKQAMRSVGTNFSSNATNLSNLREFTEWMVDNL